MGLLSMVLPCRSVSALHDIGLERKAAASGAMLQHFGEIQRLCLTSPNNGLSLLVDDGAKQNPHGAVNRLKSSYIDLFANLEYTERRLIVDCHRARHRGFRCHNAWKHCRTGGPNPSAIFDFPVLDLASRSILHIQVDGGVGILYLNARDSSPE